MSFNIKPSADRVIIEAAPIITKTKSGIYIPESEFQHPRQPKEKFNLLS